jgi:hypothetical protein
MQQRLLRSRYKSQPEALQTVFLRWLNWLLKDSRWRAYMRGKIKENELPVIDFEPTHRKRTRR